MATRKKRRTARSDDSTDVELHEGEEEGEEDGSPSVVQNQPDPDFDPTTVPSVLGKQPQPEGEVPAGLNVAGAEADVPSVGANLAEATAPGEEPTPEAAQTEGEVQAGANTSGVVPPSVAGTDQDPNREQDAARRKEHDTRRNEEER
jgi:hypothetical protein